MLGDVSVHKADFPGLLYYRPGELPGLVVVSRHRYDFLSRELARQVLEGFLLIVELWNGMEILNHEQCLDTHVLFV